MTTVQPDEIIPKEDKNSSPAHDTFVGAVEIVIGLLFGVSESLLFDFVSGGLSVLFPGTELAVNFTAVKLLEKMGITVPDKFVRLGYFCSLIPIVKNFVNSATLDGASRIWNARKRRKLYRKPKLA